MAEEKLAIPGMTVELVVGDFWYDDKSGVRLERGLYKMATSKEMKDKNIARKGYVALDKEPSPIAVIPKDIKTENLVRLEKALRVGIIKKYNIKRPTKYKTHKYKHMAVYDDNVASGFKYTNDKDTQIVKLLKMNLDDFKEAITKFTSIKMLDNIHDAEFAGMNPLSRPRKSYVSIIKNRMKKKDVGGVGKIRSENDKTIKITMEQ